MSHRYLTPPGPFAPAGLLRRLAAVAYDALLCLALLIVATFLYKLAWMAVLGEAKLRAMSDSGVLDHDPLLATLLVFIAFGFFAKFWTHNGQTLGMQAWGIRVQNADGSRISLWQALLRFLVAIGSWGCLGIGYVWIALDRHKRSWHDIYSGSQVVRVPRTPHP